LQLNSEWFVVLSAVYECKDLDVQTCSFMCCSYGCKIGSVIPSEDIGCRVQMTTQEGVCNRRTENVANDELHSVCHLSCTGSLKNSFKAYISLILRHTIMKFVVKCSPIQNFLFLALYAGMLACGRKIVFQMHLHLLSSAVL